MQSTRRSFLSQSLLALFASVPGFRLCAAEKQKFPGWNPGELDLHFIYTGCGENCFFRLPDGTGVILGRDVRENRKLRDAVAPTDTVLAPVSVPGPTAILPKVASDADLALARALVCAWSRFDQFPGEIVVKTTCGDASTETPVPRPYDRAPFLPLQIL